MPQHYRQSMIQISHEPAWQSQVKRGFDILGGLIGLVGFALLLPFLAAAILLESRGPVIFRQVRIGRSGQPFTLYKLRSMYTGCDKESTPPGGQNETFRRHQKVPFNPCYTKVGRWLSRTSLDELPQFWNILRGDMSLVGPRPCLPNQILFYGEYIHEYQSVRPGLTGLWQVSGRNRLSFEERARLDAQYVRNQTLALDIRILIKTVWVVLSQDGVW
jgi:lipopolysaccharide/colanic/teichoic acid biosynthesis glycosyltransferase